MLVAYSACGWPRAGFVHQCPWRRAARRGPSTKRTSRPEDFLQPGVLFGCKQCRPVKLSRRHPIRMKEKSRVCLKRAASLYSLTELCHAVSQACALLTAWDLVPRGLPVPAQTAFIPLIAFSRRGRGRARTCALAPCVNHV